MPSCSGLVVFSAQSFAFFFFFFNDTATTEIYTLSLHDALPTSPSAPRSTSSGPVTSPGGPTTACSRSRSEEHTSELQSQSNLVCRLLLEKKNHKYTARPRLQIAIATTQQIAHDGLR